MQRSKKKGKCTKKNRAKVSKYNLNTIQSKKCFLSKFNKVVIWLATTGLLTFFLNFTYSYFVGNVDVRYIKPIGRAYEFQLTNKSSTNQVVDFLKVVPDLKYQFLFKTTKDIYGTLLADGTVSIPGGNSTYVPAYEFKGMDGVIIESNSSKNFKIPPLSARKDFSPESLVVFLEYKTSSANSFINKIESLLVLIGFGGEKKSFKYLISENYWTPISNNSVLDPIKVACRDDDSFGKSLVCNKYK